MSFKRKIKQIIKKIKQFFCAKIYNRRKKINLYKISKITNLKIPQQYKKYLFKEISEISLSIYDLTPNCIFFCIRYNFLKPNDIKEIQNNASFVVTPSPIPGCKNIICDRPAIYGRKMFNYLRNLSDSKVIAVTGSIGKTSTKEMIESVLKQKYKDKLLASIGNSNSSYKVALNIKRLSYNTKVYLQEVGAGTLANDIVKDSAVMLESDIAVYTNIRDNHIEWYGSRENIAKEKFTLSDYGKKNGLAIINYDDDILIKHHFSQKTLSYSLNNEKADYYSKNINISSEGTSFTIVDNKLNKELKVNLKVIGDHHILNSLIAYIVGKQLKLKDNQILLGLKNYKTKGIRQNLIDLGKYKILADCYNSSYDAIKNIMKTFDILKISNRGKKIAVIGDIFELGNISEKTHRDVGKLLTQYKLDKVIFQGEEVKFSYSEYKKIKDNSIYCKTTKQLINTILQELKQDNIFLFKASHGMNFSSIIDKIFGTEVGEVSALNHKEYTVATEKDFSFYIFTDHATISNYSGDEKKIVLPNIINNLLVEKLGKAVFKDNHNIKEITIPDTITRLRNSCFQNSSLTKIYLGKNVKQIGANCFCSCSKLEKIILPENLLVIGYKAFAECEKLKEIYIPDSTQKISQKAFFNSHNITIICTDNSYAMDYAIKNKISYKIIEKFKGGKK